MRSAGGPGGVACDGLGRGQFGDLAQPYLGAGLLGALDRPGDARDADERALALTVNPAQQALLAERLAHG